VATDLETRHRIEQEYHDAKAKEVADDFYGFGALRSADEFLWRSLGDLTGKAVLEIGCGVGITSARFAQAGATVTAIDISGEMVEVTRRRADAEGLAANVKAVKMSGEDIVFPPGSFDVIYGHSILHHLNLDVATPKIVRVLKPGGVAAFLEPLDYNPILNAFRMLTPHRRTPTEQPLRFGQLKSMAAQFARWRHREFYVFSLVAFAWYYGIKSKSLFQATMKILSPIDEWVVNAVPYLGRLAWVTVVRFEK